jgi:RNA-splicing ligase RtcB
MDNFLTFTGQYNKDCKVYNTDIDENEISMLYSVLNMQAFKDIPIRIMPDHHLGKGCLIGFTAPITNMINPSHVGVDIGCSITTCLTDTPINPLDYPLIEHRIKKEIPFGMNINKKRIFEMKHFIKFLRSEYSKARSSWSDMILDFDITEKSLTNMLKRVSMDEGVFYKSLGSIGGGNHFCEIGEYDGKYAFTIHCGSRNFGVKVCKYWSKIASSSQIDNKLLKDAINDLKNKTENKRELPEKINALIEDFKSKSCPNDYLMGDNMRGYLSDMVIAQAYAKYNHILLCERIGDILRHINGAKIIDTIQSIHNYVDISGDHMIRKGAIRAYENEKMVVPFNMRDGLAICVGKSNAEWNNSCSHGAGRKMSRSKAKETITLDEFKDAMKGIYSTSIQESTIDESPFAYKSIEDIIPNILPTVDIIKIIKPIYNFKACERRSR